MFINTRQSRNLVIIHSNTNLKRKDGRYFLSGDDGLLLDTTHGRDIRVKVMYLSTFASDCIDL